MAHAPADSPEKDLDLSRTYALVVVVEILTVTALVLLGVYFG